MIKNLVANVFYGILSLMLLPIVFILFMSIGLILISSYLKCFLRKHDTFRYNNMLVCKNCTYTKVVKGDLK